MKFKFRLVVILFISCSVFSQVVSTTKLINIACKQRMITQRLCKDKIYHTMNSKVEDCAKDISSYITIFESNSTTLKNNVKDDFIIGKINKVDKMFSAYKLNLENVTDNKSAINVYNSNNDILKVCDEIYNLLIDNERKETKTGLERFDSEEINEITRGARKMRFLSQRIAIYYACFYNGMDAENAEIELKKSTETFDLILNTIVANEFNTLDSEKMIAEVMTDWNKLKNYDTNGVKGILGKPIPLSDMYDLMDKLYTKVDKLSAYTSIINK